MRGDMKIGLLFSKNDASGFWALLSDNLTNIVIATGICKGILQMPDDIVFGRIIPGIGISIIYGLFIYAVMAYRLAKRENRTDVTALPYGISTPIMFVYLFGVMTPIYLNTGEPLIAWQTGIAATFIGGIIECFGALLGPWLKKILPRAGMLGTLSGIALMWVAGVGIIEIFQNPIIGLVSLGIVIVGLVARAKMPLGIPAGLAAIVVGMLIGCFTGDTKFDISGLGFNCPWIYFSDIIAGFKSILTNTYILAIVIPIEIYNFIETMNNVESAEAAGDKYDVRTAQFVDGIGTLIAGMFGSVLPTTAYIGHPAYKMMGARSGYALGVGIVVFLASITGLISFLHKLIPVAAIAPMLVFVGISITTQTFSCVKPSHRIAVAVALIPHAADLIYKQILNAMGALGNYISWNFNVISPDYNEFLFGLSGGKIPDSLLSSLIRGGVNLNGLAALSAGAIIIGLIWGSVTALAVDGNYRKAACFSLSAAVFSLFGFIHSSMLGFYPKSPYFIAYIALSLFFIVLVLMKVKNQYNNDEVNCLL